MEERKFRNSTYLIRLPLFLALALSAGIFIGASMFDRPIQSGDVSSNAKKFKSVLSYIERFYVDSINTDELTEYAIEQMLTKLDPHSMYIPPSDYELANAPLQGDFEGIGIEFYIFRDTVNVISVVAGGPSEEAGLMPGDKMVEVDGDTIAGINIGERNVIDKLRGKKGTTVKVGVSRKKNPELLYFDIRRDVIPTYTVDASYMMDNRTGYIKISRFGAKTYDEFESGLSKLKDKGMERLILDLRDNGGGYMEKATQIADEFLADNQLMVYTDGQGRKFDDEYRTQKTGLYEDGPLIVLINEHSASASEIVAGALQDNDRALLVGRRSFGKGLVQKPIRLSDNSELRLTISRYYTPSGRSIQKPYKDGSFEYELELEERMLSGEYFDPDSISFDEDLKFKTLKGRTVYGGGGIMPDFFVPRDTSYYSNYMTQLLSNNLLREFAYQYANKHKERLEKMQLEGFEKEMYINEEVLQSFIDFAGTSGVKYVEEEYLISRPMIEVYLKALIARGIWQEEGFYRVFNRDDEVVKQALVLFSEAKKIESGNF